MERGPQLRWHHRVRGFHPKNRAVIARVQVWDGVYAHTHPVFGEDHRVLPGLLTPGHNMHPGCGEQFGPESQAAR